MSQPPDKVGLEIMTSVMAVYLAEHGIQDAEEQKEVARRVMALWTKGINSEGALLEALAAR